MKKTIGQNNFRTAHSHSNLLKPKEHIVSSLNLHVEQWWLHVADIIQTHKTHVNFTALLSEGSANPKCYKPNIVVPAQNNPQPVYGKNIKLVTHVPALLLVSS
jgi:hypothetical protein